MTTRFTTSKKSKTKKRIKTITFDGTKIHMDLKKVLNIFKKEMDIMKKMSDENIKKLEVEVNKIELTDDDNRVIDMLNNLSRDQTYKLSKKELTSFGREYIPKNTEKKDSCLEEYTNVKELPDRDPEWKTPVYTCEKGGKKYYVRTRHLKPMNTYGQKRLENELKLSKKASSLKLGPNLVDRFYCEQNDGKKILFIITEAIDGPNLLHWLKKNKLSKENIKVLKKLVNDLFKNDILPGWLSESDFIVDDSKKEVKFHFNKFKDCKTKDDLIKQEKENALQNIDWMSSTTDDKLRNLLIKKLVLTKQISYSL